MVVVEALAMLLCPLASPVRALSRQEVSLHPPQRTRPRLRASAARALVLHLLPLDRPARSTHPHPQACLQRRQAITPLRLQVTHQHHLVTRQRLHRSRLRRLRTAQRRQHTLGPRRRTIVPRLHGSAQRRRSTAQPARNSILPARDDPRLHQRHPRLVPRARRTRRLALLATRSTRPPPHATLPRHRARHRTLLRDGRRPARRTRLRHPSRTRVPLA
jgi:hypothetical protein